MTEIRSLPLADYEAGLALVERKSVFDLHAAIIEGRFWPQIGRLSRTARRPYLLVEGVDLDAGPLKPASARGAVLAVGELGIGIGPKRAHALSQTLTEARATPSRP